MARRFKILETAIRKYKAPVSTPGTAFYKYDQFRKGLVDFNVDGQARGDDEFRALTPFGLGDGTEKLAVQVSGRLTDTNISGNALSATELGLTAVTNENYERDFIPAKIIVKKLGAGSPQTSQITGVSYTKIAGDSFTFPYGRKTATDRQFDRQRALYNLIEASTEKFSATFTPERMRGAGA